MLSLLVATMLTAAPEYSVVVTRRIGLEPDKAAELAATLAQSLDAQAGKPLGALVAPAQMTAVLTEAGFPDAAVCNGAEKCVASLARLSSLPRMVSIQLVRVGTDVAIDASVVDSPAKPGAPVLAVTKTISLKNAPADLATLAAELVAQLPVVAPEPKPVAAADAPKAVTLEPRAATVTAPAATPITLSTRRKVAIGFGVGTVAAVIAGAVLGVSALPTPEDKSRRGTAAYEQLAETLRQRAIAADINFGGAILLGVTALVLWLLPT